jgi:hypothetical protein
MNTLIQIAPVPESGVIRTSTRCWSPSELLQESSENALFAVKEFKNNLPENGSVPVKDICAFLSGIEMILGQYRKGTIYEEIDAAAEVAADEIRSEALGAIKDARVEVADTLMAILDRSQDANLRNRIRVLCEELQSNDWSGRNVESFVCMFFR